MFDVSCPRCGSRRLVPLSRITALRNTDRGIHVHFTCACGAHGLWVTSRGARRLGVYWLPGELPAPVVALPDRASRVGIGPTPSPRRTVGRLRRTLRRFAAVVSAAHAGRVPF